MRVLLTGATGFVGSVLVGELLGAGHDVLGLARSDTGAAALATAGADVVRGDVTDLDAVVAAAAGVDGVVHAAFDHDFSRLTQSSEADRRVVTALGEALSGSGRPLVVSSGTGLVRRSAPVAPVVETDDAVSSAEFPRGATEEAADALVAAGCHVVVLRLAQVHDAQHQGRIDRHVALAARHGRAVYVGGGEQRVPAVHVRDAARLYRLALENGAPGARYHAVDEEGVALREIGRVIGEGLGVPVGSITVAQAPDYFGELAALATADLPASSAVTRRHLGWTPTGPGLLEDLSRRDYSAGAP